MRLMASEIGFMCATRCTDSLPAVSSWSLVDIYDRTRHWTTMSVNETTEWEKEAVVPDDCYKLFGEVALGQRFVTAEQLLEALTLQARDKAEGKAERLLGQILLELGYVSEVQISEVLNILYPAREEVE